MSERGEIISRVIRGCGNLPGYGPHPGTSTLALFAAMGAMAGAAEGWRGALFGVSLMLGAFGPMYLYGAYDRAKSHDARGAIGK